MGRHKLWGLGSALLLAMGWWAIGSGATFAAGSGPVLIMVEETGCRFCLKWEAEIGHTYAQSPEGRFAPIKRVKRTAAEVAGLRPVVFTPTFIVMRNGEEVGRVTGYPGRDYFWPELDEILSSIGFMRGF